MYIKIRTLLAVFGLGFSISVVAQQPTSSTEETQRRLRRTETRTTTTKLYPERDTILALLKTRMAVLNPGKGAVGSMAAWFTDDARIVDTDGTTKTPTEYQASRGKINYRNYRIRKLEINENTAQSVEMYSFSPVDVSETASSPAQTATVNSQLRKDPDGRWRITQMRITSK